jgi:hypothetical protein
VGITGSFMFIEPSLNGINGSSTEWNVKYAVISQCFCQCMSRASSDDWFVIYFFAVDMGSIPS